jgi:hypothetical protein
MKKIIQYHVVNGSRSKPYPYEKEVKDLEEERKQLEEKHHCFRKTLTGTERIASICFVYRS